MTKKRNGCARRFGVMTLGLIIFTGLCLGCGLIFQLTETPDGNTSQANIRPTATEESDVTKAAVNPNPPPDVFMEKAVDVVNMMSDLAYSFHWDSNNYLYVDNHPAAGVSFSLATNTNDPYGTVTVANVAIAPGVASDDIQYDFASVFFKDLGLPGEDIFRWYNRNASRIAADGEMQQVVGNYLYAVTYTSQQLYVLSIGVPQ